MRRSNPQAPVIVAVAVAALIPVVLSITTPAAAARKPRPTPSPTASASPSPTPSATSTPSPTPSATSSAPVIRLAPGSVSPPVIVGGDGAVQTVNLTGPAPAGGLTVWLNASDSMYTESAGSWVYVPAGQTSVSIPFRPAPPATDVVESLWAQVSGSPLTKVAEVTVLAADPATRAVTGLDIAPDAAVVGTVTTGTVTLKNPAPDGGIAVSLWSNTSYGPSARVPRYVVVEAGATTASFPVTVTSADEPAVVRPSADLGTSRASAKLVVVPDRFAVSGGAVRAGQVSEFAVGIGSAVAPAGATVTLSSDTPGVTVPNTVTIPAGVPGAAFPVTMADDAPRGVAGHITATWNGTSVTGTFYTS